MSPSLAVAVAAQKEPKKSPPTSDLLGECSEKSVQQAVTKLLKKLPPAE